MNLFLRLSRAFIITPIFVFANAEMTARELPYAIPVLQNMNAAAEGIKISDSAAPDISSLSPKTVLTVNGAKVNAEIAATQTARRAGFSHRPPPAANDGILFIFSQPQIFCLWMRDVSFPLDAAFMDESGAILRIARMHPKTEDLHCPPRPAMYALEMNAGWFQKQNARPGDFVRGIPRLNF